MPYHHGDLRRAILSAAVDAITAVGSANLSLRDVARRAGVSHAAPVHHFGDKAGVLTALAEEGFDLLAEALTAAGDDFAEAGVAYVRFAVAHPAHFEVMFRPDTHHRDDPALAAARARAGAVLARGAARKPGDYNDVAAWSLMHGFATLWQAGALPASLGDDLTAAARGVARTLFSG
jgi:AcrR family transcriptional regulator